MTLTFPEDRRWSSSYIIPFTFLKTPILLVANHPHSVILPPPCLIVGTILVVKGLILLPPILLFIVAKYLRLSYGQQTLSPWWCEIHWTVTPEIYQLLLHGRHCSHWRSQTIKLSSHRRWRPNVHSWWGRWRRTLRNSETGRARRTERCCN